MTLLVVMGLAAATSLRAERPAQDSAAARVERGEYLVTILGCGGCHTEGALERLPYGPALAGSKTGIAYSDAADSEFPSVVFPSNLTSHRQHGLGRWSQLEIARAIRYGVNHRGGEVVSVMPWMNYSLLNDADTQAIVSYLKSLPPIDYAVPENVTLGEPSRHRYLRIGVYSFTPDGNGTETP